MLDCSLVEGTFMFSLLIESLEIPYTLNPLAKTLS